MSEKAPQILGGTRPNVEKRFDIVDHEEVIVEEKVATTITNEEQSEEEDDEEHSSMFTRQVDDDIPEVTCIESLCMNCHENGMTKLLLTMIPYFREVILMSFECEHCCFKNSEVQFGGKVQEQGAKITLTVTDREDLNRQIIKADTGSLYFKELDFEIPPKTQRGTINTIEVCLCM